MVGARGIAADSKCSHDHSARPVKSESSAENIYAADLGGQTDLKDKQSEFSNMIDALQKKLDDRVKEVRLVR